MPKVPAQCVACGAPLELTVSEPFVQAEIIGALCSACTDLQFLAQGGAVLTLRRELPDARISLGKITITAGAVAALAGATQHVTEFLARHVRGDWGTIGCCDEVQLTPDELQRGWEVTDESAKINKFNLLNGRDEIMSEYQTSRGERLWVITWLGQEPHTTVLLPEEY